MNRTTVASARKKLLRFGRAMLRAGKASGPDAGADALGLLSPGDLARLREIHAALERIERGIYGRCEACPGWVAEIDLDAEPWERQCAACRDAEESSESHAPAPAADRAPLR